MLYVCAGCRGMLLGILTQPAGVFHAWTKEAEYCLHLNSLACMGMYAWIQTPFRHVQKDSYGRSYKNN